MSFLNKVFQWAEKNSFPSYCKQLDISAALICVSPDFIMELTEEQLEVAENEVRRFLPRSLKVCSCRIFCSQQPDRSGVDTFTSFFTGLRLHSSQKSSAIRACHGFGGQMAKVPRYCLQTKLRKGNF